MNYLRLVSFLNRTNHRTDSLIIGATCLWRGGGGGGGGGSEGGGEGGEHRLNSIKSPVHYPNQFIPSTNNRNPFYFSSKRSCRIGMDRSANHRLIIKINQCHQSETGSPEEIFPANNPAGSVRIDRETVNPLSKINRSHQSTLRIPKFFPPFSVSDPAGSVGIG